MFFNSSSHKTQKLSVEINEPIISEIFQQYPFSTNFNKVAQLLMVIGAGVIKRQKIHRQDLAWKLKEIANGVKKKYNTDLFHNPYNDQKHHKKNHYDHVVEHKRRYSDDNDEDVNSLKHEVQSIKKTLAKISQNLNSQHHSSHNRIPSPQKQNLFQSPNSRQQQVFGYEPSNKEIQEDQQILYELENQKHQEVDRLQHLKRDEDLERARIKALNTEIKYEQDKLKDDIQHEMYSRTQPHYSKSSYRKSPHKVNHATRFDITPKVGEYHQQRSPPNHHYQRSNSAGIKKHQFIGDDDQMRMCLQHHNDNIFTY